MRGFMMKSKWTMSKNEIYNSDVIKEEILKAVKFLKLGKSAGLDGVIPAMFIHRIQ